jgi:hypothetical protein
LLIVLEDEDCSDIVYVVMLLKLRALRESIGFQRKREEEEEEEEVR